MDYFTEPSPMRTRGFAVAQFCHYTLDANPDADGDARERLTLTFSDADVVFTGSRCSSNRSISTVSHPWPRCMPARQRRCVPTVGREDRDARLDKSNGAASRAVCALERTA